MFKLSAHPSLDIVRQCCIISPLPALLYQIIRGYRVIVTLLATLRKLGTCMKSFHWLSISHRRCTRVQMVHWCQGPLSDRIRYYHIFSVIAHPNSKREHVHDDLSDVSSCRVTHIHLLLTIQGTQMNKIPQFRENS